MAQLDLYLNIEERDEFISYCFEKGCHLIPYKHYYEKNYMVIKKFVDFLKLDNCSMFAISHPSYSKSPLQLDCNDINGKKRYFIMQRYGGPVIDFSTPIFAEIKNKKIGPGSISAYPFYYVGHDKTHSVEELKNIYTDLVKFIKKMCIKVKIPSRTYWIGKNTIILARDRKIELVDIGSIDILDMALTQNPTYKTV